MRLAPSGLRLAVAIAAIATGVATGVSSGVASDLAANAAAFPWVTQARYVMGTLWTVEARGPDVRDAVDGAFREIHRLDGLLSTYKPESELSRVNREAGRSRVQVGQETAGLLRRAFGYSEESGGAFDPTVGALVRLWGFKHLDYRKPADDAIAAAAAKVGYRHVEIDARGGVRFHRPGLELDLGAIAKGYAVDRAFEHLTRARVSAARVDAGGNQRVFGHGPAGREWLFGVKHPREEGEVLGVIPLESGAVSTSGDAERGFWQDGVRYGHILDPLTGRPVQGLLSVTAVAPTAEEADALSTTLYVLGPERGTRLLARHPGCQALFVQAGAAPGEFSTATAGGLRWNPW